MTIKQLKEAIKDLPDYMDVMIRQENDEYGFSLAENAQPQVVTFFTHEDLAEEYAEDVCFVITDEI